MTLERLDNYVMDRWMAGEGVEATLANPATNAPLCTVSTRGIDRRAALNHARDIGGKGLRALGFAERGALLARMSDALRAEREALIEVAMDNGGNTRGDAKFDIDGAIGTLMSYARLGQEMGEGKLLQDGEAIDMGRSSRMQGRHVFVSRQGVAILINAYNFPCWGMAEKISCAFLAGMPVFVKPATLTSMAAHRAARIWAGLGLPAGSFSFLCGSAGDLLDHVSFQDVISFTGSASTGATIRSHPAILTHGVRVVVEADSLNSATLGPDVDADSETFDLFIRDVVTDLTQKTGQKCTAIRRVLVPESMLPTVRERLAGELERVKIGNPRDDGVRMGPLAGKSAIEEARKGLVSLLESAKVVIGDPSKSPAEGCFLAPVVLEAKDVSPASAVHRIEVFGPVTTLIPYDGSVEDAARLISRGEGTLVSSFYSDDREFAFGLIESVACFQGRLVWGSKKVAGTAPSPGTVFPEFIHGGPGRAGAGEELGGWRGVHGYMQRVALQGYGPLLEKLGTV